MIKPNQHKDSSLSKSIIISLSIHLIMLGLFAIKSPKLIKNYSTIVTLELGSMASSNNKQNPPAPRISSPKPIKKKEVTKPIQKKVRTKPIRKETAIPKPVPVKKVSPTPQKLVPIAKTPETPTQPKPIQQSVPKPVPPNIPQQTTPVIQKTSPITESAIDDLSDELDNLLDNKPQKTQNVDFLAGGSWSSGSPRKTLSFPNLTASIPQQYKNRGYGFSVTAKITFSPQGWVSSVELIQTSGDPRIDSIFRTELRKIRVESSSKSVYDTITKSFVISVK